MSDWLRCMLVLHLREVHPAGMPQKDRQRNRENISMREQELGLKTKSFANVFSADD